MLEKLIQTYNLIPHPEGGYFKETITADQIIDLQNRLARPLYTSILFLLHKHDVSHFHSLQSDEIWIFQQGAPLDIVCIKDDGSLDIIHLGLEAHCVPQALVKAGVIFGSYVPSHSYSLVACIVSPGFIYDEFVLYKKEDLLILHPQHASYINLLGL